MVLRLRAIVIAFLLASVTSALAQQAPTSPKLAPDGQQQLTDQEGQRNGSAQKAPSPHGEAPGNEPAIIDPSKAPHDGRGAQQSTEDGKGKNPNHESAGPSWQRFLDKIFDDPVAFFTVWVAVFTAVLAISTIGLWRQTRRLAEQAVVAGKDTQRSLRIAALTARHTGRSARASERASETAERTLMLTQRPVIGLDNISFGLYGKDDRLFFDIHLINYGPTASIETKVGSDYDFYDSKELYRPFIMGQLDKQPGSSIAPRANFSVSTVPIQIERLLRELSSGKLLLIHVEVSYEDMISGAGHKTEITTNAVLVNDIKEINIENPSGEYFRFSSYGPQNVMT